MGERLTVLIPCKDERKNIRLCIESIRDVADEILIADSGSTDGTLDSPGGRRSGQGVCGAHVETGTGGTPMKCRGSSRSGKRATHPLVA
jgi:hypothetical protein